MNTLKNLWTEEDGQDLAEYALLLAAMVIGVAALVIPFKDSVGGIFTTANTTLANASSAATSGS